MNFAIVPDPPPETHFGDTIVQPSTSNQAMETKESEMAEDTSMTEADPQGAEATQGTKRALEEDEEYD